MSITTHHIYELRDPRTNLPRYIGKTKNLATRFSDHLKRQSSQGMKRWVTELKSLGLKPLMVVIESCEGGAWIEREIFHIADYRRRFEGILNVTDGGNGLPDSHFTPEVRARMADARRGKKLSPAHCEAMKGRVFSAETRTKMSKALTGRTPSEATRIKLRNVSIGRKHSPETRAKISETQRGRERPPEVLANIRIANKNPERCKRISESLTGRTLSEECKVNIRKAKLGTKASEETRAKQRKAHLGRRFSSEHRAKLSAALKIRHAKARQTKEAANI